MKSGMAACEDVSQAAVSALAATPDCPLKSMGRCLVPVSGHR